MAKGKKGSWVVKLRETILKEVICENCTEQEAQDDPHRHSVDSRELSLEDWEVLRITENK